VYKGNVVTVKAKGKCIFNLTPLLDWPRVQTLTLTPLHGWYPDFSPPQVLDKVCNI